VALAELLRHPQIWLVVWLCTVSTTRAAAPDEPARCEAVWIAPHKQCALTGTWAATGSGPSADVARANAVSRLAAAVEAGTVATIEQAPIGSLNIDNCVSAASQAARTTCFEEPELRRKALCYVDLPGSGCGDVQMFEKSGVVWRVMEVGRDRLCKQVEESVQALEKAQQMQCVARCRQEARVRCPD